MDRNYAKVMISQAGESWLDKGQMWMYRNNPVSYTHLDVYKRQD